MNAETNQQIPDWFKPHLVAIFQWIKVSHDVEIKKLDKIVSDAEGELLRWRKLSEIMDCGDKDRAFYLLGEFVREQREQSEEFVKSLQGVREAASRSTSLSDGLAAQFPWLELPQQPPPG